MAEEGPCGECGFAGPGKDFAAPGQRDLEDDTLILRLLESSSSQADGARAGKVWLLDPSGGEIEQALELREEITLVGRSPQCAIMLPSHTVSRRHAQIRREGERFLLRDLGSTNGTLLNSEPVIGEEALKDRDEIGIGIYRLIFRFT